MAQVRTRQDVVKLDEWHPTVLWYAKAIAEMQKRPLNDPTSWRYQSAIHDYKRDRDPNASASDVLPSTTEQQRFWNQCQHNSWFFLPWHRMYLHFFEQIVAAAVCKLGGPDDWALPYWNYSDTSNPNASLLPPAFRATTLPDGSPNPLRVQQRAVGVNEGEMFAFSEDVDLEPSLTEGIFVAAAVGGDPGFGGPQTVFHHSGGPVGTVEAVPHGSMHVAVGGNEGWMSRFFTAPLDPLFWLHHCNIDRLWSVWLNRDPLHGNPTQTEWLTTVSFEFNNAQGEPESLTCSQVTDTTASPLLYEYEDISDPLGAAPPTESGRLESMVQGRIPEMVGATEEPLTLTGQPETARVPVTQPTGPASGAESAVPKRVFLNIENITSQGQPNGYQVYLNVPPGEDPEKHKELYAGLLPMFGVAESSSATESSAGSGLHYTLDITDVVRRLESQNAWDPNAMHVTFVPRRRPRGGLESAAHSTPVQVGRVSLYYS